MSRGNRVSQETSTGEGAGPCPLYCSWHRAELWGGGGHTGLYSCSPRSCASQSLPHGWGPPFSQLHLGPRAAFGEEKNARTARGQTGPFKGRCQHRVPTKQFSPREAQAPFQVPTQKPQGCQVCTLGCPFWDGSSAPTINTSPDRAVPSGSLRSSRGRAKTSRREAP